MWLLKTHSHTSECPGYEARRPGYEARKNAKKVVERNVDTIIRQTTRQNLPCTASVAVGARRKRRYGKTNHRQILPTYRQRGGGETKRTELKENTGVKTRETKVKTLPQATIVAGGGETNGENQHEMERWHNPQSRERVKCLAENA